MAIRANSYGSVVEVAALTPRFTNEGAYDGTTTPTLTQVEKMIDRVSGLVNVVLAQQGFAIPVSQADAKLMLDDFVVEQVMQLCHAVHGAGPFAPNSEQLRSRTAFRIISSEAAAFIDDHTTGLELLGATRDYGGTYGLQATLVDDGDVTLQPPFDFDPDTQPIWGALVGDS